MLLEPQKSYQRAVVGVLSIPGQDEKAVLYDEEKVIQALVDDGMDEDDAREYFDFNIAGAYVGPSTPLFLSSRDIDELEMHDLELSDDLKVAFYGIISGIGHEMTIAYDVEQLNQEVTTDGIYVVDRSAKAYLNFKNGITDSGESPEQKVDQKKGLSL